MRVIVACVILVCLLCVPITLAQETEVPTATPEPPMTITVWWPDAFARVDNNEINPLLLEQTDAFTEQTPNVVFDHRLKAVGQTGGIMSTLRSASEAARGALPTLTLLQRQDLIFAHAAGYLHSMEGFPSSIQSDMNNALQLGLVEDELFGIPYLLELQHIAYRPDETLNYDSWTFDAMLERDQPFVFPGARANSLNDVVMLQYIDGGGQSLTNRALELDEQALSEIFVFYEAAVDTGIISDTVLDYNSANAYAAEFADGDVDTAVTTSSRYLQLVADDDALTYAPIPTASGEPISFMNGWMWVLVAQNANERAVALDYLEWLYNAERQSAVGSAVRMIPSREQAINTGLANDVPADLYIELIENAQPPLSESDIGALGRAIQEQFAAILRGEISAVDATTLITEAFDDDE